MRSRGWPATLTPREPIWVKSEKPRWPGSCVWRKITSRSGPCSARQARIRRSRVRRTPGSRSGCRCISASNTPTGRMPGLFSRIGTTSVSKISARGSGRRRPRGAAFPERRDGSSASRYPVARLKPAFAAATSIVWVFFRVMKSLFWRSVTWRPGTPALSSDSGKPKCCPTGHRRQEARGEIFARRRPETPVGLRPPSVPGRRLPSHPDCRASLI